MSAEGEHGQGDEGVGVAKPKAMRVMSRILVLTDSISPLDRPWSMEARICARWPTMRRWS